MNVKHLRAKQSYLYAQAGKQEQTCEAVNEARQAYDEICKMETKDNLSQNEPTTEFKNLSIIIAL